MQQNTGVKEGQRYAKIYGQPDYRSDWEVSSIVAVFKSLPHARLVNVDDPQDVRIVSCDTVADRRYFRLMA